MKPLQTVFCQLCHTTRKASSSSSVATCSASIRRRPYTASAKRKQNEADSPASSSSSTPPDPSLAIQNTSSPPNELFKVISTHIKTHGPLPLPRYISLCLYHPTLGYYTRSQRRSGSNDAVIGAKGDFVTSPEISQVFGELLAIWYITQWQAQGMPRKTRIIELGPGRGTLMDDMLRTFRSIKAFGQTLTDVHLVETSAYMRNLQKEKLSSYDSSLRIHWHDRIQDIPADEDSYTMIVAHEFFDALPIHAFEKRQSGFREVFVDLDAKSKPAVLTGDKEKDALPTKLRYVLSPTPTLASRLLVSEQEEKYKGLSEGNRVEISPEAYEIAQYAAELVAKKGAGLVIDYGDERFFNTSFRAFKAHKLADPLEDPGNADLTSNVDFSFLREALTTSRSLALTSAAGRDQTPLSASSNFGPSSTAPNPFDALSKAAATPPSASSIFVPPLLSQRSFLLSLGLQPRIQALVDAASTDDRKEAIIKSAQRLVEKSEKIHGMGKVFKVLSFVPGKVEGKAQKEVFPFGRELD